MRSDYRSVPRLFRHQTFPAPAQLFWAQHTVVQGDHQPHDHDFAEIVVITSGQGWHESVCSSGPIQRGDVLVLWPGTWHTYRQCHRLGLYNCCFAAELVHRELAWLLDDSVLSRLMCYKPATRNQHTIDIHLSHEQLGRCLFELRRISRPRAPARPPLVQIGDLMVLLGTVAEGMPQITEAVHPAVSKLAQMLVRECRRDWTLDELCELALLDKSYLVRLFTRQLGASPMAYLRQVRLEKSAAILRRTDKSVGEVAALVGWDDQNYFARMFHKHFGATPSEYRKTVKKGSKSIKRCA